METVLTLIKLSIGITSAAKDDFFKIKALSAVQDLQSRGVKINLNEYADCSLVADIVAWEHLHLEDGQELPKRITKKILDRQVKARCSDV